MASAKFAALPDEFGDFQTPDALAARACQILAHRGTRPASLLEPTCGVGNFLFAAIKQFPKLTTGLGIDINNDYVCRVRERLVSSSYADKITVLRQSFFDVDWKNILCDLPEPILVVGNPPWVTNSTLGAIGSSNLPQKSNFQNYNGLEALTGKSNFDISEWMLIKLARNARRTSGNRGDALQNGGSTKGSRSRLEKRYQPGRCRNSPD